MGRHKQKHLLPLQGASMKNSEQWGGGKSQREAKKAGSPRILLPVCSLLWEKEREREQKRVLIRRFRSHLSRSFSKVKSELGPTHERLKNRLLGSKRRGKKLSGRDVWGQTAIWLGRKMVQRADAGAGAWWIQSWALSVFFNFSIIKNDFIAFFFQITNLFLHQSYLKAHSQSN